MTTTKRPDGGELLTVARAAFEWIDAIPLTVVASLPAMPGIDRDWANVVMDRVECANPTIDPDYAESFERSLDLPQSAPLIGPSHNSGERLPIDKAESGADTPPTASAPDVREASELVLQSLNALASGMLSPDQNETSTAMADEAARAIEDATIIHDFLSAPPVADREAIIRECASIAADHTPKKFEGTLAAHATGRAIECAILALLSAQPAKGER